MVEVAQGEIRAKFYDGMIKQIAQQKYKFMQVLSVVSTSAWKNYFYRESTTALAGKTGNAIRGIPRGAEFPQASVSWTQVQSVIEKYGLEENIPFEDLISNDIDVQERTLIRIGEGVAKSIDDEIYSVLSNDAAIQTINVTAGEEWDGASSSIFDNLANAVEKIEDFFYDTDTAVCLINPRDFRSVMNYVYSKGAQAPSQSEGVLSNGSFPKMAGITFIKANSVPASEALVVIPKKCGTWRELVPLGTDVKEDKYKGVTIRAASMGVTQVTDPKCVVRIRNTNGSWA